MDYQCLFQTVQRHLEHLGVTCKFQAGRRATDKTIAQTEKAMNVRLPAELRMFYQNVGDGFSFYWRAESNDDKTFASLQVPTLDYLASMYTGWRELALYSPEAAQRYGFPYTDDPELAKRTAARMWHWLPVIDEENGDLICLDLSVPSCPIIFNQHDWLDGGTGDNGHPMASDWNSFLAAWGSVCFQYPRDLHWPSCFRPGGGVAWEGDQFGEPYRITGLAERLGPL